MFRILDVMLEKGSISCALGNSCKGPSVIFLHMCFSKTGLRKKAVIGIVGYVKEAVLQQKKKKTFGGRGESLFFMIFAFITRVFVHTYKKRILELRIVLRSCHCQISLYISRKEGCLEKPTGIRDLERSFFSVAIKYVICNTK